MLRLAVIAISVFGAWVLIGTTFKQCYNTAFHIGDFAVSWLLLACLGVGLLVHKVTK